MQTACSHCGRANYCGCVGGWACLQPCWFLGSASYVISLWAHSALKASGCGSQKVLRLVLAHWWVGKPPALIGCTRRLQNGTCQHQLLHGTTNFPKQLSPTSVFSEGVPISCHFARSLSKISKELQIIASVLGLSICESLHVPFKSRVSVS